MARNPDLLRRMYGDGADRPPAPVQRRASPFGEGGAVLPAFWVLGLAVAGVFACAVSFALLIAAALTGPPPLEVWGVITPEEWLLAVHDHSPSRDGTSGCALTGQRLVRFDDREATASVDLPGATVSTGADPSGQRFVEVRGAAAGAGRVVSCPFAAGEVDAARQFASQIERWTRPMPSAPAPTAPGAVPGTVPQP